MEFKGTPIYLLNSIETQKVFLKKKNILKKYKHKNPRMSKFENNI